MSSAKILRRFETVALPGFGSLVARDGDDVATRYHAFRDGEPVLVEILRQTPAGAAVRARLRNEAARLIALRHPSLVPCLDLDEAAGRTFLVYPWPGDESLADDCAEGAPLPDQREVLRAMIDACRGLEAIAQAGLAHRGLRPERLHMVDGRVQISGLGLANPDLPGDPKAEDAILAPEQVLGMSSGIPADVHALGAILHRLTTGSWPWKVRSCADLGAWARADLPDSLDLPLGLAAVIRKALARQAQQRYPGPQQLREDLERIQHDFAPLHARGATAQGRIRPPGSSTIDHLRVSAVRTTPAPKASPAPRRTTPRPRKRSPLPTLMLLGGLALAGGLGWYAYQQRLWMFSTPMAAPPATASVPAAATTVTARPLWAAADGHDAAGRWADLSVAGATQRLRLLPAGDAWIGSPPGENERADDEQRFLATVSRPFWIADSETTQALWSAVMGSNPSQYRGADLPVEHVAWAEANAFCARLATLVPGVDARLPSECEWEYAARAGSSAPFAITPAAASEVIAWDATTSGQATHPVRRLRANAWGLFDCHGNVLEWTADAYAPYPREAVSDRRVAHGAQRVARGGAWSSRPADCRSAARVHLMPPARTFYLGFRFVIATDPR